MQGTRITISRQALLVFASETSSATCPCTVEATQRRNTRTPSCASRNQNCIRSMRSTHGEQSCGTRLITFIFARRSTSREFSNQVHAARDLEVRSSNKHSVTPKNRDASFRNLGVVQDLLRKWCHQFRTAAWQGRIMTTSLSQHHSKEARLSWVAKKRAHTTTQIKMSAVTFAIKLFKHTADSIAHRFAFATDNVHFRNTSSVDKLALMIRTTVRSASVNN